MDYRMIVYKIPMIKQQRLPRHHPNMNKVDNTADYSLDINESGDLDGFIDDEDSATNNAASTSIFKKGNSGNSNQTMF